VKCGLEDVCFAYGDKPVLQGFTLPLPDAGGVCLFGPSGCGKTTALRLLAGLALPQAGRVAGMAGRRVAVVFQEDRLLTWCTLEQNLTLAMGKGDRRAQRALAGDWLARVGLGDQAALRPDQLSGGMRRRVALARALACPSDVLLLDEPFKELDEENAARMAALVAQVMRGKLLVLITHVRAQAQALCDTVVDVQGPPLTLA
jgi:NitT/TauT family transport system ATP-binding protein